MIEVFYLVYISILFSLCFYVIFDEVIECFCDVVVVLSKYGC